MLRVIKTINNSFNVMTRSANVREDLGTAALKNVPWLLSRKNESKFSAS